MKIELDKDSYLEAKLDNEKKVSLVFKTKKDATTSIVISAKLEIEQVEELIASLVSLKVRAL